MRAELSTLLFRLCVPLVFVSLSPLSAFAEDSAQVLARVLVAHKSARESIETLQAQYKCEEIYPQQFVAQTGTVIRSVHGIRINTGEEGKTTGDILVKGGETRTLTRTWSSKDKIQYRAARMSGTQMLALSDIWQRLLLSHYGPNQQTLPFEDYLGNAVGPVRASTTQENGREVVTVSFSIGEGVARREIRCEFDAKVNYLMRKMTLMMPGVEGPTIGEIEEFLEAHPGIFIPLRCRAKSYTGKKLDGEWIYSISNPVVNEPIPASKFALPAIPSGILLKDRVSESEYAIDENWNRIGPSKPAPVRVVGNPIPETIEFRTPSTTEPRPTSHWVIAGSVLALALAGILWYISRRRSKLAT